MGPTCTWNKDAEFLVKRIQTFPQKLIHHRDVSLRLSPEISPFLCLAQTFLCSAADLTSSICSHTSPALSSIFLLSALSSLFLTLL